MALVIRASRIALVLVLAFAAACHIRGPRRAHRGIGPEAADLRALFNAGFGTVRVLMLVAPT
jgi:hypothetical protein